MARNTHSYAKRQREIEKKRKADEKRARRLTRNAEDTPGEDSPEAVDVDSDTDGPADAPEPPTDS